MTCILALDGKAYARQLEHGVKHDHSDIQGQARELQRVTGTCLSLEVKSILTRSLRSCGTAGIQSRSPLTLPLDVSLALGHRCHGCFGEDRETGGLV